MEESLGGCDSLPDTMEKNDGGDENQEQCIESNGEQNGFVSDELGFGETSLRKRKDMEEKQSEVENAKCLNVGSKCKNVRRRIEIDGNESDGIGSMKVKEEISHGEGMNTIELEKVQEEALDSKVEITARALRSRSSAIKNSEEVENVADMEVDEGKACGVVNSKRKRNNASSGTKRVKVEKDESGKTGHRSMNKLKSPKKPPKVKETKESLKGQMGKVRGRPRKEIVEKMMADRKRNLGKQSKIQDKNGSLNIQSDTLKKKRGRPKKVALAVTLETEEKPSTFSGNGSKSYAATGDESSDSDEKVIIGKAIDSLRVASAGKDASRCTAAENNGSNHNKVQKRKRGRPKKVTLTVTLEKEEPLTFSGNGNGSTSHVAVKNRPSHDMVDEKIITGEAIESQKVFSDGKDAPHCSDAENNNSNHNKTSKVEKKTKCMKGGRATEQKLLREQLKTFILDAGWTIQYLPRNGREYNDAIYVSPKGRSYWSVTLAYRMLKKQYEDDRDEVIKHAKPGFTFTSIPEEAVNMLQRKRSKVKKREKKLKQQGDRGNHSGTEVICKKSTKKHPRKKASSSVMKSGGKSSRSSSKWKRLELDQDISTDMQCRELLGVRSRKSQNIKSKSRRALLARSTEKGLNPDTDGFVPYNWKKTILNWMIDMETIPLNGKVQYMKHRKTRTAAKLEGIITRDGISCSCCNGIVSISEFEAHSNSKSSQQFQNIYLEDGTSLLRCQLDSWNKQEESERKGFYHIDTDGEDPNDDSCGICGNGGDLICCDGCPSTFHQSCLGIQEFPSGDWHCIYCSCKFCGKDGRTTAQRDDNHDISSHVLLTCHLCEEKYHGSCIQEKDGLGDGCIGPKFCGNECQVVFDKLQHLLGVKHELEEGYSWSLLQRSDVCTDLSLCGMSGKVECNSKLAVALSVMDECFVPVIDERTNISLIHNVVYNCGSNFNRLNYSGFLTATLEKGDEIIAAASVRIRGNHLAEMPFIGTRHIYRRQGMCSRLLGAIETALRSLNVKKLVIPAISELIQTWTKVFGFEPLEMSDRQEMKNMNLLVFPCTDMLRKSLLDHQKSQEIITPVADTGFTAVEERTVLEGASETSVRSTPVDIGNSDEDTVPHEPNSELIPIGSGAQLPISSPNDKSDVTSEAVNFPDSAIGTNELEDRNIIVGSSHEQNSQETVHDICRKQNVSVVPKLDEKGAEEFCQLTILEKESTRVGSLDSVGHAADVVDLQLNKTDKVGIISTAADFTCSGATYSVPDAATVEKNLDENNLEASNQHKISETESLSVNGVNSLKHAPGVVVPQSIESAEDGESSIGNLIRDEDSEALHIVPHEANKKLDHQAAASSCSTVSPCSLTSSPSVLLFCPTGASKVVALSNQAN